VPSRVPALVACSDHGLALSLQEAPAQINLNAHGYNGIMHVVHILYDVFTGHMLSVQVTDLEPALSAGLVLAAVCAGGAAEGAAGERPPGPPPHMGLPRSAEAGREEGREEGADVGRDDDGGTPGRGLTERARTVVFCGRKCNKEVSMKMMINVVVCCESKMQRHVPFNYQPDILYGYLPRMIQTEEKWLAHCSLIHKRDKSTDKAAC
jgi:hypothetical protein